MTASWYGPYTKDGISILVFMISFELWAYQASLGPLSDHGTVEATNRVEAWERAYEAARFDGKEK